MKIDLNKIVSILILIAGHGFFFLNITNHIAFASISILTAFLLWMIWNKVTDTLDLNSFFSLLAISGFIVSITILVVFGIEPIGTRKGTLIHFHSSGIAVSLGVFFLSLIPYIIFNLKFKLPKPFNVTVVSGFKTKPKTSKKVTEDKYVVGDANWEIASNDDIESGDYNIE
jgi:hypothetical protein